MKKRFLIEPKMGRKDPKLPERVVLVPTLNMMRLLVSEESRNINKFGVLENTYLTISGAEKNEMAVAGPVIGAPAAAILIEKVIACGGKEIIFFGACGAINSSLRIGDIFLPSGGFSEEGTSGLYLDLGKKKPAGPSLSILRALEKASRSAGVKSKKGKIWTTDAPFMETEEKADFYSSCGAMAVDMEFAALCAVAKYRKVSFGAIMVVSDILYENKWRHGFQSEAFRDGKKKAVIIIRETIKSLDSSP